MLTRIISAAVAVIIFIAVVYFLPPACFTVAVAAICAVASYELTKRSGIVKLRALTLASSIFSALVPFFISYEMSGTYIFLIVFLCFVSVFVIWLFNYGKSSLVMTLTAFFAGTVIPLMFSVIIRIYLAENGRLLVLLPFIAAWMTDTGAYFTGVLLGKHKLCEKISPKKTVEGAVGGVVVCVISVVIYAIILKLNVNYFMYAVGALVLSLLAQVGDLSFSIIKREYNIKDYGNIMPGHGGVLDRFDSTIFTIPASYILLSITGVI